MATACSNGIDTGFVDLGTTQAAVLGVVQGITDLLPISSTAHMRIAPTFLGWPDPGSAFSAAMQLAALFAVVVYFWRDLWNVSRGSFVAVKTSDYRSFEFRMGVGIVIATIPILVGGLIFEKQTRACGSASHDLWVIGAASLAMAVLLALAELVRRHERSFDDIRLRDAVVVGLAQAAALIPGVSRSGATLTAALFMNLKHRDAARYAFLLGLPAIAGTGVKGLLELRKAGLDTHAWEVLGVGLATASLSAFVAVWALMKVMERFSTWPFVVYRGLMGAFLLLVVWLDVLA